MEATANTAPTVTELVVAAQTGDRHALDHLVEQFLPLLYNVVGRALNGHPDVDDVVQETLLRAVQNIDSLRDPERFRSWLIAIAVRKIQDHGRLRGSTKAKLTPLEETPEPPDPDADFVDVTIARLQLSDQRREVVLASRWLGVDDRQLLSLWWQEVGGEISRSEVAEALGVTKPHAAVRIQRMKAHLETGRKVMRAWRATPRCPELSDAARGWDGRANALWLKRLGRHVRTCDVCSGAVGRPMPVESLLAGLALVPVPASVAASAGAVTATAAAVSGSVGAVSAGVGTWLATTLEWLRHVGDAIIAKPTAVVATGVSGTVIAAAGAVYLLPLDAQQNDDTPGQTRRPAVVTTAPGAGSGRSVTPSVRSTPRPTASGTKQTTNSPTPKASGAVPVNGGSTADIVVAPDGDDANSGTFEAPVASLAKAVSLVKPGQTIALRGGTYKPDKPVTITTSGTATERIVLAAYADEKPVIDATLIRSNQWYVTQRADYWTVQDIELKNAKTFPWVCVGCSYGVFERLNFHDNGATALVLRGSGTAGNQVLNSDFHNNHDDVTGGSNAGGLMFKDGDGAGNVIRGVRAFHNSDDGINLSDFATPVRIETSWAYGNGVNRWAIADFRSASGCGFKFGGGAALPVAHVVTESAAWDNAGYGFTEQNNKATLVVTHNSAFRNGKDGFAFWYSTALLEENLALENRIDENRGDHLTTEVGNSWNETGWATTDLRSGNPATAEGPRLADGSLPVTKFLVVRQDGPGAAMTY